MWLWIVIGLSILVLIVAGVAFYFYRKSKKTNEFNAMLYGQVPGTSGEGLVIPGGKVPGHSGDMIEQDVENEVDYSGKGA